MYNLVELFSGIGSQAKAMNNIDMIINNAYTCEWDVQALVAYDAIHSSTKISSNINAMTHQDLVRVLSNYTLSNNGKESMPIKTLSSYSDEVLKRIYQSIIRNNNFVDVNNLTGKDIPNNIDILTYSFPCQDLSNVGAFHGYKKGIDKNSGSRSSLLWQVGRILQEMYDDGKQLPRFLLMENVPTLLSERHKPNFDVWINDLENLGYKSHYYLLNARFFGLPQNRPRLLMISVYVGDDLEKKQLVLDYFEKKKSAENVVNDYMNSKYYKKKRIDDLLCINYDEKKYFDEAVACTPNDTISRRVIWNENPQIVKDSSNKVNKEFDFVRTITCKQDRHPNSGNLYFDPNSFEGFNNEKLGKFRYLTPRECFLFMGFEEKDFDKIIKNNPKHHGTTLFSRDKLIRMAGNSIPVKLLEGIFLQIKQIDNML